MSFKREREETPDLLPRQDSLSPDAKRVKTEVYKLDFGDSKGCTLEELWPHQLEEIADDDALVNRNPALRKALIDWANKTYKIYTNYYGAYYDGHTLGEAPISWINSWIYATGAHKNTRTRIALKYHFIERKPEMPGSKWVFTYGTQIGKGFDEINNVGRPIPYDEWTKSEGIGTAQNPDDFDPRERCRPDGSPNYDNRGKDNVADALIYNEQVKLKRLLHEHVDAPNYRMSWYQPYYKNQQIKDVPLEEVIRINDHIRTKLALGQDVDEDLWAAIRWRMMKHHLVRWNWRGHFETRNGERIWVPGDLGRYLYPSTEIEVSDEPYFPRF